MKWGQRFDSDDEVPEELRGKSPKDVAAALKKAQELEAKHTEIEEARVASEQKATQMQTEIDALKVKNAEYEARGQQKTPEELEAERLAAEPPSPWTDPEKFVQDQTKGIANVALTAGMMTAKMYFTQGLAPRDQKIFRKYEKEVEQVVGTFAPQIRVMPQSWMNALLYVKGLHDVDIHKAESTNTDFFSETASRGDHHEEPPQDTLTDEESKMCDAMHWDKAGYLKRKKEMTMSQSSKGAYARFSTTT